MKRVTFQSAQFKITPDEKAFLFKLCSKYQRYIVPNEIVTKDNKKYPIKWISVDHCENNPIKINNERVATVIAFYDDTIIDLIPTSFILNCKNTFFLPTSVKRIQGDCCSDLNGPMFVNKEGNKFVSVSGKRTILNNHPMEVVLYQSPKSRIFIRETTKIVGIGAFGHNNRIKSVFFPASVEIIDSSAFYQCQSLQKISFAPNSKLKKIQNRVFEGCKELTYVTLPEGNLEVLGTRAFVNSKIATIHIPGSVKVICPFCFSFCDNLTSVTFGKESKLERIGEFVFISTNIQSFDLPSSVKEIENSAFSDCSRLSVFNVPNDTKLESVAKFSFKSTAISRKDIMKFVRKTRLRSKC